MRISSSFSEFRRKLAEAIGRVKADREPPVVTRGCGRSMTVLVSPEDFASHEETRHLLRSPGNAERLMEAVAELESGAGRGRTIPE